MNDIEKEEKTKEVDEVGYPERGVGVVKGLGSAYMKGFALNPYVMIALTAFAIVGLAIGWGMIMAYHLVTACAFFILGSLFVFVMGMAGIRLEGKIILVPIVMAIAGYFLEFFNLFALTSLSEAPAQTIGPTSFQIATLQTVGFDLTIRIEAILMIIIIALMSTGLVLWYKRK